MNGLDRLLQEIQSMAQDEADQILRSANAEVAEIEEKNRGEIESQTQEILSKAKIAAKNISERGISNQSTRRRNEILALKQSLIRETVDKAKQRIAGLTDSEYFGMLKNWAGQSGVNGQAVIHLNKRDIARSKGDFLESFPEGAEVRLSGEPADISGGFLAVCGGVTINCSVDAVFDARADAIHHELRRILFD